MAGRAELRTRVLPYPDGVYSRRNEQLERTMTRRRAGYRTAPMPRDWERTAAAVLRDHAGICHICGLPGATEVDHMVPVSRGGSDLRENLRPAHGWRDVRAGRSATNCHGQKTAREARGAPRRRPAERHPGEVGA